MVRRNIASALAHIVPLAILVGCGSGSSGGNGGSGGTRVDVPLDTTGFSPFACAGEEVELVPGLSFAMPADYAELWEIRDWSTTALLTRGSVGMKCGTATDAAACQAAITAATTTQGFRLGECQLACSAFYFVVNRGDQVLVVDTDEGLKSLLGDIDAPADAALTVLNARYAIQCANVAHGGVKQTATGFEVIATQLTSVCSPVVNTQFRLGVDAAGNVTELDSAVSSSEMSCIGRRPPGLVARRGRGATRLGAYFAEIAELEAASVHAFATLRDELSAHGAPTDLIARADEARRDEIRHTRVMTALARRFGGRVARPRVAPRAIRSLEALAVDNAAEGCVRETFGALLGAYQAHTARDPAVREVMAPIARDEMRHGELSWAIDAWAQSRLGERARQAMLEARRAALEDVISDAGCAPEVSLGAVAGLPSLQAKQTMTDGLARVVGAWDAA